MSEWTDADVPRMDGCTVVITGANGGLGYEATRVLARKGATVVMACRSVDRGERAAAEIRRVEGRDDVPKAALDVRECDLASLASIRSFAEGVAADYDAVDVLCNNAGVMAIPRSETEDGFETQFGVNHLGHFALTGRLFPLLRAADGEARIVTHSSAAHEQGEMDFTDLNWERSYGKWRAYARSKLANLLFAYELQRRLEATGEDGVKSVACHPGYADTGLQGRMAAESGNPLVAIGAKLGNALLAQDAKRGAWPLLYAATADVDGGAYVGPGGFLNMRGSPTVMRSNEGSYDRENGRRLWAYSAEATGVRFPFDEDTASDGHDVPT